MGGLALGTVARLCLYLRPNPYGGPFVQDLPHYLPHALFYGLWGMLLLCLPNLLVCWIGYRRRFGQPLSAFLHWSTVALLAVALFGDHFDNEVMRYMGLHPDPVFFQTYRHIGASIGMVPKLLATDSGGPWVSLLLWLALPAAMVGWGLVVRRRERRYSPKPWPLAATSLALAVAFIVPAVAYGTAGGKFRLQRVRPLWITLATSRWSTNVGKTPSDLKQLVADYQNGWRDSTTQSGWEFTNATLPYVRNATQAVPRPATASVSRIIVVQVESLRGLDVGFLDPRRRPSATPFLDAMASRGRAFTRALSFGPPTVNAFIGAHCSIGPHRGVNISVQLVTTRLFCFPEALKALGYHTAFFTANDPDWDGQSAWLDRWYDEHHYYVEADEDDRVTLRLAAKRIAEIGRQNQSFLATLVTATNHAPFESRDSKLDVGGHDTAQERILNTVHFTDVALAEFFASLRQEAWFDSALFVFYGDHGYNLGERASSPAGQRNGFVESTWVPLVFSGNIGSMQQGLDAAPVSLLDLAPTIAELAGYHGPNPWTGASLLWPLGSDRWVTTERNDVRFGATTNFQLVHDRAADRVRVFAAEDRLQRTDIASEQLSLVRRFESRSKANARLNDYLLESNQVWPSPR